MNETHALIPEVPGRRHRRLGRHVLFDERSRSFRVKAPGKPLVTKIWERKTKALNQGSIGSCTGNAAVGVLATAPYAKRGMTYDQALARKIYTLASQIDTIRGEWPPEDTGSTVLAAAKALHKLGLISAYNWALGIDDVLQTLSYVGPVEVGLNWYDGFDKPNASGLVKPTGSIQGGHAFELHGIDVQKELVWAYNSWGSNWGLKGRFCLSFATLRRLLKEDGEAMTPVTVPAPAPTT